MDLREYFGDVRKIEKELEAKYPNRVVYITSIKNSMKNSTAGATFSAIPYNAARGIADETHREATAEEIQSFLDHQEKNRVTNQRSEAGKKKEIVVVMDRQQVREQFPQGSSDLMEAALAQGSSRNSDDD